jgi:hypothetical protein
MQYITHNSYGIPSPTWYHNHRFFLASAPHPRRLAALLPSLGCATSWCAAPPP